MRVWIGLFLSAYMACAATPSSDQIRDSATRAVRLLQASQKTWYSKIDCHSCHHQFQPAMAFRVARAHGVPVNEAIAHDDALHAYLFTDLDAAIQYRGVQETVMDLGYSLVAANATGLEPNLASNVLARLVAGRQDPSGRWDDLHQRPPQSYSNFTQTAIGLRAIQLYSHPSSKGDVAARVDRARAWLLTHQPRDTEERSWQLIGLAWAGGADEAVLTKAAQTLAATQHPDGGWSSIEGRDSDAYSTGEALVALHDAGGVPITDARWRRGIEYLVSTQAPDGSWHVASRLHPPAQVSPAYFESGYPYGHDQYLSASAASYAIMALSTALGTPDANALGAWKQEVSNAEPWAETVLFGSVTDLKKLLDGGFDPNSATKSGGTTALMMAAPDAEKVKLLIDGGANVNARAKSGFSALMVAALYRDGAAARELLAHGADVSGTPSPLMLATTVGNAEILKPLHDAGAPLDRTVVAAVRVGKAEAVKTLLDIGAKVDEPDGADITPLERAVLANEIDIARLLIARGANVNHVGRTGMTPLLYAASIYYGDSGMIALLLKSGARKNAVTKEGLSAAALAVKYGNTGLAASLR
ncbi:MAG TPA: ankyrin repeat domain-containing protein [Bryobacteraceae bacterium]|nr:ankyrin repeat domain-containing protein [Bryobacteraceae bacterium]